MRKQNRVNLRESKTANNLSYHQQTREISRLFSGLMFWTNIPIFTFRIWSYFLSVFIFTSNPTEILSNYLTVKFFHLLPPLPHSLWFCIGCYQFDAYLYETETGRVCVRSHLFCLSSTTGVSLSDGCCYFGKMVSNVPLHIFTFVYSGAYWPRS